MTWPKANRIVVHSDGTFRGTSVTLDGHEVEARHVRVLVEAASGVRQTFEVDVDASDEVPAEAPLPVVVCETVGAERLRAMGLEAPAGDYLADPVKIAAAMRRAAEPERCGIVWPSGRRCNLWVRHAGACVIAAEPTAPDATPGSEF